MEDVSKAAGWREHYESVITSADEAVRLIKDGDRVFIPDTVNEPLALTEALERNYARFHNVELTSWMSLCPSSGYMAPEMQGHFRMNAFFAAGNTRQAIQDGRADFSPAFYQNAPSIYRTEKAADVALCSCTPPDENGYCSLGCCVTYNKAPIEQARVVIAQVNRNIPYTYGDTLVHCSAFHAVVLEDRPLPEAHQGRINDVSKRIGAYCAQLIEDGSTLQLGIGSIPDAVLSCLGEKKDLGIYAELFSDGVLELYKKGVITNRYTTVCPGKMAAGLVMGTKELYDWCDHNPNIEFYPIDWINNPFRVAQNHKMVAINSCLQVDLYGQVNSEWMNGCQYSGTGGQVDFVRGAQASKGGKALLCLPSTAAGGSVSRIVPTLPEGTMVTTLRNDVDYIVTEYGSARLKGLTVAERAVKLINIAHPAFRRELEARFKTMTNLTLEGITYD